MKKNLKKIIKTGTSLFSWAAFFCLSTSLFLVACNKEDNADEDFDIVFPCTSPATEISSANVDLLGSWEWVNTITESRNGDDVVENPQNTFENRFLDFKIGNVVEKRVDNATLQTLRYEITKNTEVELLITFYDQNNALLESYFLQVCEKTLVLINAQSSVGSVQTYRKK
ncbi:hypothetical protein [Hugenholtzia roseola]|uniref:hypothetical protein n=1 Tax=Hugenholtzia roseola TaxID=1002 RepID=UPI0004216B87|nr:hypothetical protein [Hugenholtzia roseola]